MMAEDGEREESGIGVLPSPSVTPQFAEDISGDLCAGVESSGTWNRFWFAPKDQCDGVSPSRPTPATALMIILWIPLSILLAFIYFVYIFGGEVIVRGQPPPTPTSTASGVLFVCTHLTLMDPVVLALVLGRRVPTVTYSISRESEILSPIPTVRLSRDWRVDSDRIKAELARGDLVVCPEGTTCRGSGSRPRTSATGLAPASPSVSATPMTLPSAAACRGSTPGRRRTGTCGTAGTGARGRRCWTAATGPTDSCGWRGRSCRICRRLW
ncbi:hypothetical protein Taro_020251 [Colocasia esculenta]|uniref:Phospholipid/glycerol acyltransferase domain-containing protein n=1 Tax=Colocasia esculenta TaxID=4460 RepID=A0A843UVY0_COLES|nr:hypothetical protein [Colocasia esculenta]